MFAKFLVWPGVAPKHFFSALFPFKSDNNIAPPPGLVNHARVPSSDSPQLANTGY